MDNEYRRFIIECSPIVLRNHGYLMASDEALKAAFASAGYKYNIRLVSEFYQSSFKARPPSRVTAKVKPFILKLTGILIHLDYDAAFPFKTAKLLQLPPAGALLAKIDHRILKAPCPGNTALPHTLNKFLRRAASMINRNATARLTFMASGIKNCIILRKMGSISSQITLNSIQRSILNYCQL